MLDTTSCIQFGSVLPNKALIVLSSTGLVLIWMAWSGFGQMHLVPKHASVQESLGQVLAECNQPATTVPVSQYQTQLCSSTDDPDHIVQNKPGSSLVPAGCVRSWPNGSVLEASHCHCPQIIGPLLTNTSKLI